MSTTPAGASPLDTSFVVIRSEERQRWKDHAVDSRQSFPATGSFDLIGNSFGVLMVHNDDIVSPGEGFDMHHHDNAEIVTWVLEGTLRHRDDRGKDTVVPAGWAQAFSAGTGIVHSEVNHAGFTSREKVHVVQMWLPPDYADSEPRHAEADFTQLVQSSRTTGDFFIVATGEDSGSTPAGGAQSPTPLRIGTEGAELQVAYPASGSTSSVPAAPYVHYFVAQGSLSLTVNGTSIELHAGDAVRYANPQLQALENSEEQLVAHASQDSVIVAWRMTRSAKALRG